MPEETRKLADEAFGRLKTDPRYPSLHFKKVARFWSARVGTNYRALAVESGDDLVWFWIGKHSDYEEADQVNSGGTSEVQPTTFGGG